MDALRTLYGPLWIPQAVFDEYQAGVATYLLRPDLMGFHWITISAAPTDPAVPTTLDPGEAEAIALARAVAARLLLIDEQRGRAAARRLGLPVSGSLGVLLEAKAQGIIPLVRPYLNQMLAQGRHIGLQLQAQVLALAGE